MTRSKSLLRTLAEPLLVAVVLAFAVRAAMRIYSIPSRSMAPTLEVGDHIVVTPYRTAMPERGDVVVFRSPASGDVAVKRVVAVPGDLIESRLGRVRVSGHTLPEPYLFEEASSGSIAPQVVPAGCYFVMGDNRADSHDSRSWGPLPGKLVLGRARVVLWGGAPVTTPARAAEDGRTPPAAQRRGVSLRRIFKWIE